MRDTKSDTPPDASPDSHLGFRIAVAVAGLVLIGLFALLGSVAMKQSATTQALDARQALGDEARSAPARE